MPIRGHIHMEVKCNAPWNQISSLNFPLFIFKICEHIFFHRTSILFESFFSCMYSCRFRRKTYLKYVCKRHIMSQKEYCSFRVVWRVLRNLRLLLQFVFVCSLYRSVSVVKKLNFINVVQLRQLRVIFFLFQ